MSKNKGFLALINATPAAGETVTIQGVEIALRPVTVLEVVRLVKRFPTVKSILLGGSATQGTIIEAILDEGPDALAAVIAVAAGNAGDAQAEAIIGSLPDDDLITVFKTVYGITMPNGVADFFGRFRALAGAMGLVAEPAKAA